MTLISSAIPSFTGGVSQQPPSQRLSSQLEEQINGYSTVSQGLQKRPPTEHIAKIFQEPLEDAYLHTINRDASERYLVVIANGDLKVFDLEGNEKTVAFPDGKDYLASTDSRKAFSSLTIADYTFITNKSVPVAMSEKHSPARPYEALVNVKLGNYGKGYSIIINGVAVAGYTTPDGSVAAHINFVSTDFIAQQLYNGLVATSQQTIALSGSGNVYSLPAGYINTQVLNVQYSYSERLYDSGRNEYHWENSGWVAASYTWQSLTTLTLNFTASPNKRLDGVRIVVNGVVSNPYNAQISGSCIYLSSDTDFSIDTVDGYNDTAMVAIKGKAQKVADLPNRPGINGFKCLIVGEAGSEEDDYWVEYNNTDSTGVWEESVAPDIPVALDATTMPHVLVREADGTFTFKAAEWNERTVGDEYSNSDPSFVGRKISSMFFFRNRLGFLADDSLIMSENGEFFNFFRTSVKSLLDSDVIDVAASHTKVALLHHAVPYNKQLVLFSEQSQFILQDADVLTAETAAIKQTTDYPCSTVCTPVCTGKNVYFLTDKGIFSSVREFFTNSDTTGEEATDITAHIPEYIPKGVFKIAQSPTEDIFILLSEDTPNVIYPYSYYWNNSQKLQSAWSKWEFPETDNILYIDFINSVLYLVVSRSDGVYLESMDVSLGRKDTGELYRVMLDRKTLVTPVAKVGESTVLPAPYPYDSGTYYAVTAVSEGAKAGRIYKAEWDGEQFTVDGDVSGIPLWFGRQYIFTAELSTIYPQQGSSSGTRSYTEGRLMLRTLTVNFADTGYFKARIIPEGRSEQAKKYTGKQVGTTARVGTLELSTGSFRVPIMTKNINTRILLENDSPLPSAFTEALWEGDYVTRSQRF